MIYLNKGVIDSAMLIGSGPDKEDDREERVEEGEDDLIEDPLKGPVPHVAHEEGVEGEPDYPQDADDEDDDQGEELGASRAVEDQPEAFQIADGLVLKGGKGKIVGSFQTLHPG